MVTLICAEMWYDCDTCCDEFSHLGFLLHVSITWLDRNWVYHFVNILTYMNRVITSIRVAYRSDDGGAEILEG